jgi:hypothetical protein
MKSAWIGSGFSHHSVPSLSNTATRSSCGTASATVRSTNATIAFRVAPSFQLVRTPVTSQYPVPVFTRARSCS